MDLSCEYQAYSGLIYDVIRGSYVIGIRRINHYIYVNRTGVICVIEPIIWIECVTGLARSIRPCTFCVFEEISIWWTDPAPDQIPIPDVRRPNNSKGRIGSG